jgi:hypothetical protein
VSIKFKTRFLSLVLIFFLLSTGCTKSREGDDKSTDPSVINTTSSTTANTIKPSETAASQQTNAVSTKSAESISETSSKDDSFIFPESHLKKLDEEAVIQLRPELLPFARNEIFARRGYVFTKEEYKDYFESKSWYKSDSNFNSNNFNDIEKYNIELVKSYEDQLNVKPPASSPLIKIYKADITVSIDLNGDGVNEKVIYKPGSSQLLINNKSVTYNFDTPVESFAIADLDTKDSFKELLVSDYGPSDDYSTNYYYFDGTNIVKMGETEGLFKSGIKLDGQGKLIAPTRGSILQTWFFDKSFQISKDHKLAEIYQELYSTDSEVTLKMALKLYKNKGDTTPSITVNKGQKANIIGTDDKEWCLIKTSNGTKGWIALDSFTVLRNNGLEAQDVFDGLCYAD